MSAHIDDPTGLARNHWRHILSQYDVPPEALTGKHTACPYCGGQDRFRFDNKEGAGTYYCSGCGAGTGYSLLMKLKGVNFGEALKMVKDVIEPGAPEDKPTPVMEATERRASLNRLWKGGTLSSYRTTEYLISRGLSEEVAKIGSRVLRFTEKAWLREEKSFLPAILALVTRLTGEPVSIHRTFLLPNGGRVKKMMPGVGELAGAGVWFGPRTLNKWIVGEGIETTLAGLQLEGVDATAVAALNANMLEQLEIPDHVTELVILADNDSSFTGMKSAAVLANKVAMRKAPCEVTISSPAFTDKDMLDALHQSQSGPIYYFTGGRHG